MLADALTEAEAVAAGSCPVAAIRDALPADDHTALDEALTGGTPSGVVAAALSAIGHRVAPEAVASHRVNDCPCAIG